MTSSRATPLSSCDDGVLARAVSGASGEDATAAETELYRRFAPRVRLFGLKHLSERAAADDLAQQVMLVVITRLRTGEVREPDHIGSFVLGTSRMMVAGKKRGERRRAAIFARFDAHEEAVDPANDLALDGMRLAPCLAALRERERTILLLTYYADKSAPEIAAAIGTTAGAVRIGRRRCAGDEAARELRRCRVSRCGPEARLWGGMGTHEGHSRARRCNGAGNGPAGGHRAHRPEEPNAADASRLGGIPRRRNPR